jgi:hypothetical protein
MVDDEEEWGVKEILDKKRHGHGKQYLVKWVGYGDEENRWIPHHDLEDCKALDRWERGEDADWEGPKQ